MDNNTQYNPQPQPWQPQPPQPPAPTPAPVQIPAPAPVAPTPTPPTPTAPEPAILTPQPVIQVFSPHGVEYVFQAITLFSGAFSLGGLLLVLVNGHLQFAVMAFPLAVLLVSTPVFAWLFLRHKKAELLNPALKLDASKRRTTQAIQIVAFLVSFFTLIGFVSSIFAKFAGEFHTSIFKLILDIIVIEAIAGGVLAYYWRDEHKLG